MFHPSKMAIEDVGDRLMSLFNDLGTENREEQLRKEIREARYLLKSLQDQEKTLKGKTISYKSKQCFFTRQPILASFTHPESDDFNAPSKDHDKENILRREIEVLKLCHGVQLAINDTSTEAKLILTPTCRGIFYGPFNVRELIPYEPEENIYPNKIIFQIIFTMKGSDFSIKSYQLLEERSIDCQTTAQVMKSILKKRYHKEFSKKPYSIVPLNMLAVSWAILEVLLAVKQLTFQSTLGTVSTTCKLQTMAIF